MYALCQIVSQQFQISRSGTKVFRPSMHSMFCLSYVPSWMCFHEPFEWHGSDYLTHGYLKYRRVGWNIVCRETTCTENSTNLPSPQGDAPLPHPAVTYVVKEYRFTAMGIEFLNVELTDFSANTHLDRESDLPRSNYRKIRAYTLLADTQSHQTPVLDQTHWGFDWLLLASCLVVLDWIRCHLLLSWWKTSWWNVN